MRDRVCANCLSILYILDVFSDKLIITDHNSPLTLRGCKVFLSKTNPPPPELLELEDFSIPDSVHTTPPDHRHICKRDLEAKRAFGLCIKYRRLSKWSFSRADYCKCALQRVGWKFLCCSHDKN